MDKFLQYITTPIGELTIACSGDCITHITCKSNQLEGYVLQTTPIIEKASEQLFEYFNKQRTTFDLKLLPQGGEFAKKALHQVCKIPYGFTATYAQIAKEAGSEKAYRAVGAAMSKNTILIVIPCHRVIGSTAKLTGYAAGIEAKKFLLNLESPTGTPN